MPQPIGGPSPSPIHDASDFEQVSTGDQSGKLNQVADDTHVRHDDNTVQADSDYHSHPGKTDKDSAPKFYGDPLDASAMKSKLDAAQAGSAKTKVVSSNKGKDGGKLPPDEQAVKDAGGDKALKSYQQFKDAALKLPQNVHDTLVAKFKQDVKELDDLKKKLQAHPSDVKTQLEFQKKLDQVQKDFDAVTNDPFSKSERNQREIERNLQQQNENELEKAVKKIG